MGGTAMLRRISSALVLALLVSLPATAQDYQKGLAAAKRGDYAAALKEWRPLAEQGHAIAPNSLGTIYRKERFIATVIQRERVRGRLGWVPKPQQDRMNGPCPASQGRNRRPITPDQSPPA